ncbi:AAA family ATPase, partial [Clostridiaceae bacterium UIB06]|nr:AAA family ATPase [Clostridiaceae bacterium UIB06]
MDYKDKVKSIFLYLLNVKNLEENIIRNIWDYEKLYWESELLKAIGCSVNKNGSKEWWLKVNKKCKNLYDQFIKIYLAIEKEGKNLEIAWGHGLIVWRFHGHKIVHPVLTTKMKLNFDSENEAFILTPSSRTEIETSIFEGMNIPNLSDIHKLKNRLSKLTLDPRNIEYVEKILTEAVSYLSVDGRVEKDNITADKVKLLESPIVYDIPVIFIRKSNTTLWQREINNIINEIDRGYPIPQTVKAIVEDRKIEQDKQEVEEWSNISKSLFFHLSANHEQKEIIKRISENYGVVVQGAPGTGKSHTIVNLVSHLVAHGKRVLVTSHKEKAIKVLIDKIPEQIKPLCVSVLGNDNNSLVELNESLRKIIDNMSADPEKLYKEIECLKSELELCRKNQHLLCERFKEFEKVENQSVKFENREYTIIDVAKWVKENQSKYSWVEDEVKLGQDMPLTESEFEKLIGLLREVSRDYKESLKTMNIMLEKLPSSSEICDYVYRFKEL